MSDTENLTAYVGDGSDQLSMLDRAAAVTTAQDELTELGRISDSLESLITVLSCIPSATLEHLALTEAHANTLLAGTGYGVSTLFPNLESSIGQEVSLEDARALLTALWERIKVAVAKVAAALLSFVKTIVNYTERIRYAAQRMKKRAAVFRGRTQKTPNVDLGWEANAFIVGTAPIRDGDALLRGMVNLLQQYVYVSSDYPKGVLDVGKRLEAAYSHVNLPADQYLTGVIEATQHLPLRAMSSQLKTVLVREPRFGTDPVLAAPALLGGKSLFLRLPPQPQLGATGSELLTMASRCRQAGVLFRFTDVNANNYSKLTLRAASAQQIEQIADQILRTLDAVEEVATSAITQQLAKQSKQLLTAAERAQKPAQGPEHAYYESALRFAQAYAGWAAGPSNQMTTHLLNVCRSALVYGNKSLRTY